MNFYRLLRAFPFYHHVEVSRSAVYKSLGTHVGDRSRLPRSSFSIPRRHTCSAFILASSLASLPSTSSACRSRSGLKGGETRGVRKKRQKRSEERLETGKRSLELYFIGRIDRWVHILSSKGNRPSSSIHLRSQSGITALLLAQMTTPTPRRHPIRTRSCRRTDRDTSPRHDDRPASFRSYPCRDSRS